MTAAVCATCGGPVASDTAEGLCPLCLMAAALRSGEEPDGDESTAPTLDAAAESLRPKPNLATGDPLREPDSTFQVGPYVLVRTLGEGGMGVVYLAHQASPISRDVALKVLRSDLDSRQVVARFEAERQALALMDHPGIARVLDAGTMPDGRPYFVMEHVPGLPITDFCDANRLDVRGRLWLFQQVCAAVHHAHARGIIHRDLKPSNVLVSLQDGRPATKIIDFGIAKALHQPLTQATLVTQPGMLVGTLEYMSPERLALGEDHGGTASDIYSLGVLLYELLTGSLPFPVPAAGANRYLSMARAVDGGEPPRPSRLTRSTGEAEAAANLRGTTPRGLRKRLRGELEWITLRAIDRDPGRRYASAAELAADIGRHLSGDPVLAARPTTAYRLRKFARKNRLLVGSAGAILLCIVAGLAVSTSLYLREQRQREYAEVQAYVASLANAGRLLESADYAGAREQLFRCAPRLRAWEWRLLYALTDTSVATLYAGGDPLWPVPSVGHFAFDERGERVTFTTQRAAHSWRVGSWQQDGVSPILGRILGMSSDASMLASLAPGDPDTTLIVDARSGAVAARLKGHRNVSAVAFSANKKVVATASGDGVLRLWETASGFPRRAVMPRGSEGRPRLAFAPGAHRLAWSAGKLVRIVDLETGAVAAESRAQEEVLALACRSGGQAVAIGDAAGRIRVWQPGRRRDADRSWTETDAVHALAFSVDGTRLASAARNGAVRVWEADDGVEVATLTGVGQQEAAAVAFSPDGRFVLAGSRRGVVWAWELPLHGGGSALERRTGHLAASGDLSRVAVTAPDRTLLLDSVSGRRFAPLVGVTGPVVALDTRGTRLATGDRLGRLRLSETQTGRELRAWNAHAGAILSIAFAPNDRLIASAASDHTVKMWDLSDGHEVVTITLPEESGVVAFSPDGERLVCGSGSYLRSVEGGAVTVWSVPSGQPVMRLAPEWEWGEIVRTLAFDRKGERLAIGELASGTIRICDPRDGRLLAELRGPDSELTAVTFSPDGSLLASASRDAAIRLWDTRSLEPVLVLTRPGAPAADLAFSADGSRLYAACMDGSLRMWSTASAHPARPLELLTSLARRYSLWADVREHLRADRELSGSEREEALRMAASVPDWSPAAATVLSELAAGGPSRGADVLLRRAEDMRRATPWSLDAASLAGGARYRNGLYDEAIQLLETTSAAQPEGPLADLFLAMSYARRGRPGAARRSLDRAYHLLEDLPVVDRRQMDALAREAEAVVSASSAASR